MVFKDKSMIIQKFKKLFFIRVINKSLIFLKPFFKNISLSSKMPFWDKKEEFDEVRNRLEDQEDTIK